MTKEQQIEYDLCKADIVYFAENYVPIRTLGINKLVQLRDYQKDMLRTYQYNRNVFGVMTRQLGDTTLKNIYVLWKSLFFNDTRRILILNHQKDSVFGRELLSSMYGNIPDWFKFQNVYFSNNEAKINNNIIKYVNISKPLVQSLIDNVNDDIKWFDNILFDNFSYVDISLQVPLWQDFVLPHITKGKQVINTSCYNGKDYFYGLYTYYNEHLNNCRFYTYKLTHEVIPERDEKWKELEIRNCGIKTFNKQYLAK